MGSERSVNCIGDSNSFHQPELRSEQRASLAEQERAYEERRSCLRAHIEERTIELLDDLASAWYDGSGVHTHMPELAFLEHLAAVLPR